MCSTISPLSALSGFSHLIFSANNILPKVPIYSSFSQLATNTNGAGKETEESADLKIWQKRSSLRSRASFDLIFAVDSNIELNLWKLESSIICGTGDLLIWSGISTLRRFYSREILRKHRQSSSLKAKPIASAAAWSK